jgi:hypothetical protein
VERRAEEVARLKLLAAPLVSFLLVIGSSNSRNESEKKNRKKKIQRRQAIPSNGVKGENLICVG